MKLLKERAQQLRDCYNYIILSYSGGHDSQTILNTFVNNNIYIDEIYIERYARLSGNSLSNREQTHGAIPYLNHIRHKIPNTKVTLHDNAANHEWFLHRTTGGEVENRSSFGSMLVEQY